MQDQDVSIRGVGTTGNTLTHDQAAPFFLDGIHFGRQSQAKLAFLDIESLEVLKGPQPVYFGMNVATLERTGPSGFQYRVEAIFVDGMPIDPNDPDVQREVYQGRLLGIDVDAVMPDDASVATFEQKNGSIEFRFR